MATFAIRLAASSSRAARRTPAWTHGPWMRTRSLHERRPLAYSIEEGLGDFLPPRALKTIAEDYQEGLLERLNEQVRDTALEGKSVTQTVVEAARDPSQVLAWNYASEALNNSFFLDCLRPPKTGSSSNQAALSTSTMFTRIREQYGSLEQFKSTFSAAALAMFSSGWVWCVCDEFGKIAVYPTFGPGTLLVRSGESAFQTEWSKVLGEIIVKRAQEQEPLKSPAAPASPSSGASHPAQPLQPPAQSRSFSTTASSRDDLSGFVPNKDDINNIFSEGRIEDEQKDHVGDTLFPLFCVSVHEHAWMSAGYGVWGKEEYMQRFWSVLDWERAEKAYNHWSARRFE
ncbi:hypothetical protein IEO21_01026 [Rhodonia placenta]|uniref:Manganese/iron superoxide dismutase C-terminal domain-containing protein n=2 Tax=Rhodonia placenta TaxID=104341 RepID=A0A1X6MW13_9APHY|nr:hypothetical protein POSPLADRAFT_1058710 [Postia placenta MAD-698-R-SB12]KAF9821049.1 hypothetical protein IEO21_01026 [Postia placenta]OSX60541.1 hypothetical protein POSPLADRAFT_1058710 [Postia placenta MAD-698-R-SB12]